MHQSFSRKILLKGAYIFIIAQISGKVNVGALWHRDSFKCLRLHLNDVTFPDTEYYDFIK